MDGWADVCVGIKRIEIPDHLREQVVTRERGGTKLLTGGENQIYHDRNRICKDNEMHKPPERAYVIQQRIQQHSRNTEEPCQIRNQKQLTERNQVVQRAMHRVITRRHIELFNKIKENSVNRPEQQQLEMTKRLVVQLRPSELPIYTMTFSEVL